MSLYFIRHGESIANREGFLAGQLDVAITEMGIAQARAAADELNANDIKIDKIISSPLSRAYDTAKCVAEIIDYSIEDILLDADLMERNMGFLQGESVSKLSALDGMNEDEQRAKGVETESMLEERVSKVLSRLTPYSEENILIVSHNGFGRRLAGVIHGVNFRKIKKIPNAEVIRLMDSSLLIED